MIGKNRHMGEVGSVIALVSSRGNTDADILKVINPPASERDRSEFLDASYSITTAYGPTSVMLPSHAEWRNQWNVGVQLNPTNQIVRSNHFKVNTAKIPGAIYQYGVHLYRYDRENNESTDCSMEEDFRITATLIMALRDKHPEWNIGAGVGFTYNLRSLIYTSSPLPLTGRDIHNQPFMDEIIFMKHLDGTDSAKKYRVALTLVSTIIIPSSGSAIEWGKIEDEKILLALDTPLLSFARWGVAQDDPEWFVVGSKAFRSNVPGLELSPSYTAMRGYYAGLKTCLAGLVLVSDMSVSCFLTGAAILLFGLN